MERRPSVFAATGRQATGFSDALLSVVLVLASVVALAGCFNPLTKLVLSHVKDLTGPGIELLTPRDGDVYGGLTTVTGTVTDLSGEEPGHVASLTVEVVGLLAPTTVTVNSDGSFSHVLATSGTGFDGDIVVKLTAADWNGNTKELSVGLVKGVGDIPSFSAVAGNGTVTLSWDPVPGATGYAVYYVPFISLPKRDYPTVKKVTLGSDATDYTIGSAATPLANGEIHSFQLEALTPGADSGDVLYSDVIQSLPLTETILQPTFTSEFGKAALSWNEISNLGLYEVYRSDTPGGEFTNISGPNNATTFTDTTVERGKNYWYRIKPGKYSEVVSGDLGVSVPFFTKEPLYAGSYDTDGWGYGVAVSGSYAYVADGDKGLVVLDISNPAAPVLSSTYTTVNALNVTVFGNYAYVADGTNGLLIFDIAETPGTLKYKSMYSTGGTAYDVAISGSFAYVACNDRLVAVNISDPLFPAPGSSVTGKSWAQTITVSGTYAYVGEGYSTNYLRIYNLSTPGTIPSVATGSVSLGGGGAAHVSDVVVSGSYAYVVNSTYLVTVDVSSPAVPSVVGTSIRTPGDAEGVALGAYLYVADYGDGLLVYDISTPSAPAYVGMSSAARYGKKVTISSSYAFVANSTSGLVAFEVASPSSPALAGSDATIASPTSVALSGSYAYMAAGGGIVVLDIASPATPAYRGSGTGRPGYGAAGVAVSGSQAYVARGNPDTTPGGIVDAFDVSNPTSPTLLGSCELTGMAMDLAVSGHYAYVANYSDGLSVLDISNPAVPVVIGSIVSGGKAYGVAISGSYAYVAAGDRGLAVLDISNPAAPTLRGSYYINIASSEAHSVAVSGSYAYVADGGAGLVVLDVSNPSAPTLKGSYPTGSANDVAVSGSYAYVADSTNGLVVLDISKPTAPVLLGSVPIAGYTVGVAVAGRYAYIANSASGLVAVRLSGN